MDIKTKITLNSERFSNLAAQARCSVLEDCTELLELIASIAECFITITQKFINHPQDLLHDLPLINECLKNLRAGCTINRNVQIKIANISHIFEAVKPILLKTLQEYGLDKNAIKLYSITMKTCWQFIGNLCVANIITQDIIWRELKDTLYVCLQNDHENVDICTMIIYNIYLSGNITSEGGSILKQLLQNLTKEMICNKSNLPDFLQIFLEHFITVHNRFIQIYVMLNNDERLLLLFFIVDFMKQQNENHQTISKELLQYICKEFKKKSDCVLKTVSSYVESIQPKEVTTLLEIISSASHNSSLLPTLAVDSSLFINVGYLLQAVHSYGKKSENIFTPVSKLGQIAPSSTENANIERDISYGLKSTLVRVIGNLAHRNKKNQDLAREMEILMVVLDCTNMDARNPLIKEWSVLTIRHLCENNQENQQIIASLTKVGDADNSDILKEFNIDLGSMRINPST